MKINACWLYGIQKYGFPCSIDDSMRAMDDIAALGFTAMELEGVGAENLREIASRKKELKNRADAAGLRIVNYGVVMPDVFDPDSSKRKRALGVFDYAVEAATWFGCETLQFDSYSTSGALEFVGEVPYASSSQFYGHAFRVKVDPKFDWNRLWDATVDSTIHANEMGKKAGLKVCMEGRVGDIVQNTAGLLRLMDWVKDDNFGAVLDVAHAHAQKEIIPLSVEQLGKRIFYVHVADNDGRMNEHLAVGQGTIDWEGAFTALKKHGFGAYVGVDVGGVPDLDTQFVESRRYLEDLAVRLAM